MKRHRLSPLRRRELAQDRARNHPRGFEGLGPQPAMLGLLRGYHEQKRQRMLVAYAAALGQKRGQLPADPFAVAQLFAMVFEAGLPAGTAKVEFFPSREVNNRGRRIHSHFQPIHEPRGEPVATIELRHLDWAPDAPVEETLAEAA